MSKFVKLPESELLIMQVLWKSPAPLPAAEITKELPEDITWKPSTLLTLIGRLIDKGFIEAEKSGRCFFYKPLIPESSYLQAETKSFFQRLHKSSLKSFMTSLYDSEGITEKDIDEMLQWIKERKD